MFRPGRPSACRATAPDCTDQNRRKANTFAPAAGLPSGKSTRPWMTFTAAMAGFAGAPAACGAASGKKDASGVPARFTWMLPRSIVLAATGETFAVAAIPAEVVFLDGGAALRV